MPWGGGRDLWCVKGAKNGYEMIQSLIAYPFFKDCKINLWQKEPKVTLSRSVTDQKWKLKFPTPMYCSPSFIAHKSKNKNLNPFTPWSDLHRISPYNITSESNIKVMRIKKMIIN